MNIFDGGKNMKSRTTIEKLEVQIVKRQKVYIRYAEGVKLYSIGKTAFIQLANEAGAVKKINGVCIVNTEVLDEFIEKNFS